MRAFGEMVAPLRSECNHAGAIQLEALWNELAASYDFCLFCAYSMTSFGSETHSAPFAEICSHHSRVIQAESYVALDTAGERRREITLQSRRVVSSLNEVSLPGRQSTSLAIFANELVSNAVKHGCGEHELTLRREGNTVVLEVCDDGVGFPGDFDPGEAGHMGLELVENIAHYDLSAHVSYRNWASGGARVSVSFPIPGGAPDSRSRLGAQCLEQL